MTVQEYICELRDLCNEYRENAAASADEESTIVWQEKAFTLALAMAKARGIDRI